MLGLRKKEAQAAAVSVQTRPKLQGSALPLGAGERELYRALRESVPIIDASVYKLRRLIGEVQAVCHEEEAQERLNDFLQNVQVNAAGAGINEFLGIYLEELITYGNAVGEMVLSGGRLGALYNAGLQHLSLEADQAMGVKVSVWESDGKRECQYPELLVVSALNPPAGSPWGTSLLRGLPFVSDVLLKIYQTLGVNWDRLGNVRFAVTCKPEGVLNGAAERARQMAEEWKSAMSSRDPRDFVAVGDVSIKAIGADNQILESDVPVRQMLEQIVAKLGLPPFLLGLSWSSTERMSSQQADVLTSELEAYRRILTPVAKKICRTWLALEGYRPECEILWDEITMQDEVDHANARYLNARAAKLEYELEREKEKGNEKEKEVEQ
ncbi:serine/threonine protein phosphatase [Acutalibacter sp. 1XD8-33]|uniref:serine/threonine protein phosphatase n=1 Tax=Acutalibacter sp. 1XD8-33 TaxID=2320081 RepID=UPI000EA315B4|nr:serine/threonine protein phosphatase [Acutalibacter sp. 1XD8-33]RKJ39031.1 serine/threonine protein phosphatase [Acutalibacter sp. 1XD8-33]